MTLGRPHRPGRLTPATGHQCTADRLHIPEGDIKRIGVTQLRADMSRPLADVAHGKERLVLQTQNRDYVAVVPLEDLVLLEELEDQGLAARALRALAAGTPLPRGVPFDGEEGTATP